MAKLEEKLTEMLEPGVEALGFELVGIEFVRAGKLLFFAFLLIMKTVLPLMIVQM